MWEIPGLPVRPPCLGRISHLSPYWPGLKTCLPSPNLTVNITQEGWGDLISTHHTKIKWWNTEIEKAIHICWKEVFPLLKHSSIWKGALSRTPLASPQPLNHFQDGSYLYSWWVWDQQRHCRAYPFLPREMLSRSLCSEKNLKHTWNEVSTPLKWTCGCPRCLCLGGGDCPIRGSVLWSPCHHMSKLYVFLNNFSGIRKILYFLNVYSSTSVCSNFRLEKDKCYILTLWVPK